jgi:simple sugar transport system substrate-binding protein
MKKISKLVASVITVVVVGSIIWFATSTVSAAAEKPKYTFYVVTHGVPGCPFWSVVNRGAGDAGKILNVKVVYTCPDRFDIKKVADLLEAAVEAKPDGIVCPITSAEAFDPILRRAIEKDIPLIVHNVADLRPPEKRIPYKTYVGEDSWACGYEVMKHALKRMKDEFGVKVNHVMFGIHEAGNVVHETRGAGAIAAIKEMAPDATYEKVMVTYDLPKVAEITKSYLTRHPETNLILNFNSIVAHTACSVIKDMGLKGKVFNCTHDVSPELVLDIKDDTCLGVVGQQQYLQGYLPIVLLYLYNEYGFEITGTIPTGPFIADKYTIDATTERIEKGYGF